MDYVLLVLIPPGHEALTHTTSEAKNSIKRSKCWSLENQAGKLRLWDNALCFSILLAHTLRLVLLNLNL